MGLRQDRLRTLRLYLTVEHACGYLEGRAARNLVADPRVIDNDLYAQLARLGFRRSGEHVYRPHCLGCSECLSLRIPVARFRPNRTQVRTARTNADLRVNCRRPVFSQEHFQLFGRYLRHRHPNGGMDNPTPESYLSFIAARWSDTRLYEFRQGQALLGVAVVDHLEDGLSAVYTFFDPQTERRSLGTYAILWQIGEAARLGLDWVYLGYWIRHCQKMAYKAGFRPHEIFIDGQWQPVP